MPDVPTSAAVPRWPVWFQVLFAVVAVGVLTALLFITPRLSGDGHEYLYTMESLARHGSPDLSDSDKEAVVGVLPPDHPERLQMERLGYPGYPVSPRDGKLHALHFFAYSASALPARFALDAVCISTRSALQVTNGFWLLAGMFVVIFLSRRPLMERLTFATLAGASPVIWHLIYSGTEVYSWSLAVMGLVALGDRRFVVSGLLFGVSALQNPSVILLGGAAAGSAVLAGHWRRGILAALGSAVGLLPMAYCQYLYGQPSLIAEGYTDWRLIGVHRTLGLLTCLNQGLLPYVPVLLLAFTAGVTRACVRRAVPELLITLALLGMLLSVQVQKNWNSDGCGMIRYLVWMVPAFAWVASAGIGRWWWGVLPAALLVHGAVLIFDPPTDEGYTGHRPIAAWVLAHHPSWYDPDPEVFVERGVFPVPRIRDGAFSLPAGFADADGNVTKLLVDRATRDRLPQIYRVSPDYLSELLAAADSVRPVYIHPPPGSVQVRP